MTERVNSERHANIAQKVTQAMEHMRGHGLLNQSYPTTEAFVDELQKYLKITKRCDKDHIADCWPTRTVTAGDGTEVNISAIRNGKRLNLQTSTNNVGLVFADGASIILNYDPSAKTLDIGDKITANTADLPVGNGKSKNFAYTSDVTSSIDFITDVNGRKGPNSETVNNKMHDIRSFNIAKIKGCAGTDVIGIGCIVQLKTYSAIDTCNDNTWDNYGSSNTKCDKNAWAGAKSACKALGSGFELPSSGDLKKIYDIGYSPKITSSGWFWSSSFEGASRAYAVGFGKDFSDNTVINPASKDHSNYGVICVGD